MSLALDSIFSAAIQGNNDLMTKIGGRLWSTAIPMPDERARNVRVPYCIVIFEGLTNEQQTKDDPYESDEDQVSVSIILTASTRVQLAELANDVRSTIHQYMMENSESTGCTGYQFNAEGVTYDQNKPCYWQTLRYVCDVTNFNDEQDEED